MNSVSKVAELFKGGRGNRDDVFLSDVGLHRKITRKSLGQPPQLQGVKRGKITTFSKSSSRRLREVLFYKCIRDSRIAGVTFTLPWLEDDTEKVYKEFAAAFQRFKMAFVRAFPHSAFVWRVELQRNGNPHLHAVVMVSIRDGATDDASALFCWVEVCTLWEKAVLYSDCVPNFYGFLRHGTQFQPIGLENSPIRLFRYLIDHASKHKADQLGWQGRQWGVVGSKNLVLRDDLMVIHKSAFANDHQRAVFWRIIRKISRYRIEDARCVFGSRFSKGRQYGVIFGISPATCKRALDFALEVK